MGCAGSKGGVTFQSEESKKDAAANALQLAASAHLKKKGGKEDKATAAEKAAKAEREAEAAKLLQKAATAHLALAEPMKPPGLSIPVPDQNTNIVVNVIDTARKAMEGLFGGQQEPPPGARPPSLAIPAPGSAPETGGDNIFQQALNSARGLFQAPQAEGFGGGGAEDLAARLEAEATASAADATATAADATPTDTATSVAATADTSTAAAPPAAEPQPAPPSPEAAPPSPKEVAHPDAYRPSLPSPEPEPEPTPPPPPISALPPTSAATPTAEKADVTQTL